jgi:hypothetical protein
MLARAGLPNIRFHDLSETACCLLQAADISIVVAQRRGPCRKPTILRHDTSATTSTLQIHKKEP